MTFVAPAEKSATALADCFHLGKPKAGLKEGLVLSSEERSETFKYKLADMPLRLKPIAHIIWIRIFLCWCKFF